MLSKNLKRENQALIISTSTLSGFEQMALDKYFLEQTILKVEILFTLRFYYWEGNCISLGFHQKEIPSHWQKLSEEGTINIIRRPSGGGAVLHSGGITYALTFKKSSYKNFSYDIVNKWLIGCKLSIMTQGAQPLLLCRALMCSYSLYPQVDLV